MIKSNTILIFLLLCGYVGFSQPIIVTGSVNDATNNEPLPGVNIVVEGTTAGSVTDIKGQFSIEVNSPNAVLVFSSIGFETQTLALQGNKVLQVALVPNIASLDEVVVTGYGSQRKKDITGSIAVIDDEVMDQRLNTQVGALIQGKAAGVQVLSSSGKPSQGLSIRIRGISSVTAGSEPLYVIDGIPTSDTRSLNPADIESISILKDAASAAIYGAQGGNGVVIISTKRGQSKKPSISFDSYVGFSQVWRTYDVLDGEQYRDLMTEMGQNTNWDLYYHNTNWQDEIFQNGSSQNYQLAVSGVSDKTNYYLSGGWTQQIGAVRSAEMSRANLKINIDQQVNKWLKVGGKVSYADYSDVDIIDNQSVNKSGVLLGALCTPSIITIYNPDGTFTSNPFQNWENPIASTDGTERGYSSQNFQGNAYIQVSLPKRFSIKSVFGFENKNGIYESFLDPYRTSYGRALKGESISNIDETSYYNFENTLNYEYSKNKNEFKFLFGRIDQKFLWENNNITTRNFASDGITTPNAGSEIVEATAYKSEKANISYISRINYAYNDKYIATANFRADGSSVFGPENRWGYFPSFSVGWRIGKETFMQGIPKLNDLKIRAGWGIVGNDQIENYAYLGRVGGGANYPIGGVIQPGTYPASVENQTLKWEESNQTNIGIDAAFFENRVAFTIDAYIKNTYDLLLEAPLPLTSGFNQAIQNVGELQNKGIEMSLNTIIIDGPINWSSNFNISFNRNEVIDLVGQELYAGSIAGRGEASLAREGLPLGTLFGYVYSGVDPNTGNALYLNANGEETDSPTADDRVVIGDANPNFYYGFTNNLSYKQFNLTIFLQGAHGNDMLNATRIDTEGMTDPKNQSSAVTERWKNPGDITDIPRSSWGNTDNSRISTRFIEDGSYLRFKTVSLSYNFKSSVISKVGIANLKLYSTFENLLTFTKYSGYDPEVNTFGGDNVALGVDFGTYPQTRNFIIGINLIF